MHSCPARAGGKRLSIQLAILLALAACGGKSGPTLLASGIVGSYEDGSGRTGIAAPSP